MVTFKQKRVVRTKVDIYVFMVDHDLAQINYK